jgi:hypothetical protein
MLKLRNVETALKPLEEEESEIKNTMDRLLEMDMKMKSMEDELINQNTLINNLVKKINDMEEHSRRKKYQPKRQWIRLNVHFVNSKQFLEMVSKYI